MERGAPGGSAVVEGARVEEDRNVETAFRRMAWGRRLLTKLTCPNCWHTLPPEDILFIAKHPELLGDPVLGSDEYLRFAPTRV